MSETRSIDDNPNKEQTDVLDSNLAVPASEVSSVAGSVKNFKNTTSERQIKFERAQRCLENAALVSKKIKEHRKATAELLGRPFEDDAADAEMASTMSEKTNYSVATDTSTTLSVQAALNIPGISESLANTLKQKELLMERIKQYKEISKKPARATSLAKKETIGSEITKKSTDNTNITQLSHTIKEKENAINLMQVQMRAMETTILDLQEKITEKDQIIEAKNRATTLISDSLSKKERDTLDLLEDTKLQMTKMQSNFIVMETEWTEEKQRLLGQIKDKDEKIKNLEEANTILENSRFEISVANSKLTEELESTKEKIIELEEQIKLNNITKLQDSEVKDLEQEKGSLEITSMEELTKKIEILEHINYQIRQTNKDLENQLSSVSTEVKSPSKKESPLPTRKGGRNTKSKSPWSNLSPEFSQHEPDKKTKADKPKSEMILQSLNKDILDKEYIITQKDEIISKLELSIVEKDAAIHELQSLINSQKGVPVVEVGTTTEELDTTPTIMIDAEDSSVSKQELQDKLKLALGQIETLNNEIDIANKNMIKVKSSSKLKLKQMQKSIENLSKVSDAHAEIVKLNEEIHQLSQKVAELEEEKGNLQLHLVDYDSGRLTETEIYKKMVEMENLAEARLKSITLLETQKFDLVQELHNLQQKCIEMEDKLADMSHLENEQVCSEMKSVQLEEQLDELISCKKEMELIIENIKLDKEHLNGTIKILNEEKVMLSQKLENYIQENIELADKLEKLSGEKVSSAESIEIVESLTTQEKLDFEEYNKSAVLTTKVDNHDSDSLMTQNDKELTKEMLISETLELKSKIELFTQEREEVMDKMNKILSENETLHKNITDLEEKCKELQDSIQYLSDEKNKLKHINDDLSHQIEDLKQERIEILKETLEVTKRPSIDDVVDGSIVEAQQDDKLTSDKTVNRSKSVKQLTKEILKLKNTIKEREDEIADCQMKILSLEEQQEKQKELLQSIGTNESLVRRLTEENKQIKKEIQEFNKDIDAEQTLMQLRHDSDRLQLEMQKMSQEYSSALHARDSRIHELDNLLIEYEKQVINYVNSLQQKDKEISEYINQITKLNDVSKKLKSTIDLLENEKAQDQNLEIIKGLNKQISLQQNTFSEYEEKLRVLENDKVQLISLKSILENKNTNIEAELKIMQETLAEKQELIKNLETQQHKQSEELSTVLVQVKERDEDIHEIKLQLRKESIENEKLRTTLEQKDTEINEMQISYKDKIDSILLDKTSKNEQFVAIESKNKELMEKLKKFAVTLKKKSAMYADLEKQSNETLSELELKNKQLEQLSIKVEVIPELIGKLKYAEEEVNQLQSSQNLFKEKYHETLLLQAENMELKEKCFEGREQVTKLNEKLESLNEKLRSVQKQNGELQILIDNMNKKMVEYELEQKNNTNLLTKISCLEAEIAQKQIQIGELSNTHENHNEILTQIQHSHDAKIQEQYMYIEGLQSEIERYKSRINRLQESISKMENSRQSLERKADQLDTQLQDKQKAYTEYSNQEDELVSRLAALIDHDQVVEKQLNEIESENKKLKDKIQNDSEEIQRLQLSYSELDQKCHMYELKANKLDLAENEIIDYQTKLRDVELQLKKHSSETQTMLLHKKTELEDLEVEFSTQIENAVKDKKILSEKYEKLGERTNQLEIELQQNQITIENLNTTLQELSLEKQKLLEQSSKVKQISSPDYTEQYIGEINKLNSILNNKNEEIFGLSNKIQSQHITNLSNISCLENKLSEMAEQINNSNSEINKLVKEIDTLRNENESLQAMLQQKDEQIKQLMENKKLVFEMNIPKTEGMTISSTIEALDSDQRLHDIAGIESQIVSYSESVQQPSDYIVRKEDHKLQKHASQITQFDEIMEPTIVSKKAYLCHNKDDKINKEHDMFNSEEGWGLEANVYSDDVTPGLSHLNKQLQQLRDANKVLKIDLETSNSKFNKALKKLKELKSTNEMLSNELKLTKQISQSSMLDMAIENELSTKVQVLEKKVQELNTDLNKEKVEKEALNKQNEIFKNANDRLMDIKEKMDNEIELWKYNFKQANDKLSSVQWDGDGKEAVPTMHSNVLISDPVVATASSESSDEIVKLEKENDELQNMIDSLNAQNKIMSDQEMQLKTEINILKQQLQECSVPCENCELLERQICILKTENSNLQNSNSTCLEKVTNLEKLYAELQRDREQLKSDYEEKNTIHEQEVTRYITQNKELQQVVESLKHMEEESNSKISLYSSEIELLQSKLEMHDVRQKQDVNSMLFAEKYDSIEDMNQRLTKSLDEADKNVCKLNISNQELQVKNKDFEKQISELGTKINNLNTENDQLLSTVTELRSSISSAVDQRGYEIAELWKQHLTQRENEFQALEQDLRNQLNVSEAKYEQLLENVQSSSEEETSKIIMCEQVSSLQNKLQEKEEHLLSLQNKYAEVINQLDILRSEMEVILDNKILVQQEEYENKIKEITSRYNEHQIEHENLNKTLQSELDTKLKENSDLNKAIDEIRKQLEIQVLELTKQLRLKESEIFQKTHDFTLSLTQRNEEFENVRKQLIEYEKRIEELTYEKESELAILRLKMHEQSEHSCKIQQDLESEKNCLTEALNKKIVECTNLNKTITDLNKILEEYANKAKETQLVLESQELEIVTLKDEIASLNEVVKSTSTKIEKHVTFASDAKKDIDDENVSRTLSQELLDAVPKAELDLAMYMLHQRDVRCEELTMELTQLLEERDTLQLRLSDSLRSYEELKLQCNVDLDQSFNTSLETVSELPTTTAEKDRYIVDTHRVHTSRSSSISELDGDKPKLQAKLSELRSVRHSRDVRLRHDSEQRQMGMRLLHRDVANLPPEAIDQLTQAHHTLSRDSQSTSTVLLNWLRGKSTPKVVDM